MVADPAAGGPQFIQVMDNFNSASISANRWNAATVVGSTTVSISGGALHIINAGSGTKGISYLESKKMFPRFGRIGADIQAVDGSEAGDGDHFEASVVLYKDVNNWLKIGPYRDTSEGINYKAYLRVNVEGVEDTLVLSGDPVDTTRHAYTLVLLEHEVLVYVDSVPITAFDWPELVNYTIRLEAGTTANADKCDAAFKWVDALSYFDFALMQMGLDLMLLMEDTADIGTDLVDIHDDLADVHTDVADIHADLVDVHSDLADLRSDMATLVQPISFTFSGALTLTNTALTLLTFTQVNYGTRFKVHANFDLEIAKIEQCKLYSAHDTTWYDMTGAAQSLRSNDTYLAGDTPNTGDIIYFGMASASWKQLDVFMEGGTSNTTHTYVWEYWNGSAWVSLVGLVDGTDNGYVFGKSGRVTWSSTLSSTEIDGVTAYWVRARLSSVGASTNVPRASRVQAAYTATCTGFDSNAAFLSTVEVTRYRKRSESWQTLPIDKDHFTQCILDRNVDVEGFEAWSDVGIGFQLLSTPTRNVVINYYGYIEQIKA